MTRVQVDVESAELAADIGDAIYELLAKWEVPFTTQPVLLIPLDEADHDCE